MNFKNETKNKDIPPGVAMALLIIWLFTFLLTQFVIWASAQILNINISWLDAAGLSLMWNFLRMWFAAMTRAGKDIEK
jgi:hypothetical protein